MPQIGSKYTTQVTDFAATINGFQKILSSNPRRLYVKFIINGAGMINSPVVPGAGQSSYPSTPPAEFVSEYKWKDCPSIVSGEFYANISPGFNTITIIECLYTGES